MKKKYLLYGNHGVSVARVSLSVPPLQLLSELPLHVINTDTQTWILGLKGSIAVEIILITRKLKRRGDLEVHSVPHTNYNYDA